MRRRLFGIGVILLCGGAGGSCSSSQQNACSQRGCGDALTVRVDTAAGELPSGMHRIEVLADGVSLACAFRYPLERTAAGTMQPSCSERLGVLVPADGAFSAPPAETIILTGTPAQVHVWQYVDDLAILDAAVAPSYEDVRPNGPGCEPVCREAQLSWTLQ